MSVVPILGRDPATEARALLNCVLRDGDVIGTDDAGRTALLLLVDPWTLDHLLAFDAEATDLEDTDGEPEPDEELDGLPIVVNFVPPSGSVGRRASHGLWRSLCCSQRCPGSKAMPTRDQ
jgi:hypothetical protein